MPSLGGMRFGVIGLGRSGLGVGKAVKALGGEAILFDSQAIPTKSELVEEAHAVGLETRLGWNGELPVGLTHIVVNPAVDPRGELFLRLKASRLPIWGEIEFAYRIAKAPIVAITGTNGKSTTVVMTYLAFEACGQNPLLCGNLFGSGYPEQTLTEAALVATEGQVLVAEVSSFQLETISSFRPAVGVLTNLAPDHQDRYDRYSDYVLAKQNLLKYQTDEDYAILPSDHPFELLESKAQTRLFDTNQTWELSELLDPANQNSRVGELPFASQQVNVLNAHTATLAARAYLEWRGVTNLAPNIFEGLRRFRGLANRLEILGERGGVTVINNSMCTNPEAVIRSSLSVVGRQHLLIGGVNKGLAFDGLANYIRANGHSAYLYGRDREALAKEMGLGDCFETLNEAFCSATRAAQSREVIMLAPGCASMDQYKDFVARGDAFRAMAREWIG